MSDQPAIVVEGLVKHFGDVHALDGIDLSVRPGTVYGLLGPNGAGKTTAVRVLTTIITPDAGRAEVLGLDVVRQARQVRANIGLAGQNAASLVHRPRVLFLDEPTTGLDPRSRNDLWDMIRELVADGTTLLLTTQYLEEADVLAERLAVIDRGLVIAEGTPGELKARLGSTVLEVGFDDDESARAAVAVIGAVAPGGDLHGRVLHITVDDGPKVAMEVLRALDQARLSVGGLALREPSLDDVFLTLTGHRAVEPSVDGLADGDGDGDGDSVAVDPGRRPTATTSGGAA